MNQFPSLDATHFLPRSSPMVDRYMKETDGPPSYRMQEKSSDYAAKEARLKEQIRKDSEKKVGKVATTNSY